MMQQKLIKYICEEIHMMDEPLIQPEENLLENDLLDSMGVMRLVAYIEGEFEIKISPQDLTVENFSNVISITNLVESKKEVV